MGNKEDTAAQSTEKTSDKPKRKRVKVPADVVAEANAAVGKPPKKDKAPPKSKTKPRGRGRPKKKDEQRDEIERAERVAEALDYRRQGYTYEQIGEAMGQKKSTVYGWVKTALQDMIDEPAEEVKRLEIDRYDLMYQKLMEQFLETPDPAFVGALMQLSDRRLKLHGVRATSPDDDADFAAAFTAKFIESIKADRPILRPDGDVPANPVM